MNIFRVVLEAMGWSKRIKDSLRNPSSMKQRERDEFEAAEAADRVSSVDQSETQVKADLFEDILADWFEAQGIRLRRQPEMVKEQSELLGVLFVPLICCSWTTSTSTTNPLRGLARETLLRSRC